MKFPTFKSFATEKEPALPFEQIATFDKENPKYNSGEKSSAQLELVPKILDRLAEKGVTQKDTLKIKFVFMGNSKDELKAFRDELKCEAYCANVEKQLFEDNFLMSGYTYPIQMQITAIQQWIKKMCAIGNAHKLEFLGWGVNVN